MLKWQRDWRYQHPSQNAAESVRRFGVALEAVRERTGKLFTRTDPINPITTWMRNGLSNKCPHTSTRATPTSSATPQKAPTVLNLV